MNNTPVVIATGLLAAVLAERGVLLFMHVARRTGFLDRPGGYKAHAASTPYLGGAAVLVALLVAANLSAGVIVRIPVILTCAVILSALGTVDDRITVSPYWRLIAEAAAAVAVWAAHRGFTAFGYPPLDLALTLVWVVGLVNAFNLFDNLDGACATIAGLSALGAGTFGLIHGHWRLAALALALAGACGGFLRHNLARPARIFLGDGGSMPLGFLIACLTMAVTRGRGLGVAELSAGGLMAGLPILDTALVVISRRRRGISVMTGGRDHLTHRLLALVGSPQRVAAVLGAVQCSVVALAVIGDAGGPLLLALIGLTVLPTALAAIFTLEFAPRPGASAGTGPEVGMVRAWSNRTPIAGDALAGSAALAVGPGALAVGPGALAGQPRAAVATQPAGAMLTGQPRAPHATQPAGATLAAQAGAVHAAQPDALVGRTEPLTVQPEPTIEVAVATGYESLPLG